VGILFVTASLRLTQPIFKFSTVNRAWEQKLFSGIFGVLKLIYKIHSVLSIFCIVSGLGVSSSLQAAEPINTIQNKKTVSPQRIISLGGDITEIVYALNAQQQLVATDTTSSWPKEANKLPKVGYFRALSAEGILSLSPDLLLMSGDAGPATVIEQLQAVKVPIAIVSADKTAKSVTSKIQSVATAINLPEQGDELIKQVRVDFEQLELLKSQIQTKKPRVVFLFSVAKGSLLAAGTDTAADAMISLAAGTNVFSEYSGYKPVNSEVLIAAAPEILLLTDRVLDSLGGVDGVLNFPGISLTPAGKNKRVVVMDTLYLLGFGPRTAQAALDLTHHFHPEAQQGQQREQ
jgi:iron complex transport system substrate-binding protein